MLFKRKLEEIVIKVLQAMLRLLQNLDRYLEYHQMKHFGVPVDGLSLGNQAMSTLHIGTPEFSPQDGFTVGHPLALSQEDSNYLVWISYSGRNDAEKDLDALREGLSRWVR